MSFTEIEHVVDFQPNVYLSVEYKVNLRRLPNLQPVSPGVNTILDKNAMYGNIATLECVLNEPNVSYSLVSPSAAATNNDKYFTLVMIDSTSNYSKTSSTLHWLIVNIPNENIRLGEVKSTYLIPNPQPKKGGSQYTFLLYKQKARQEFKLRNNFCLNRFSDRSYFNLEEFTKENTLELFAMNFFYILRATGSEKRKSPIDFKNDEYVDKKRRPSDS